MTVTLSVKVTTVTGGGWGASTTVADFFEAPQFPGPSARDQLHDVSTRMFCYFCPHIQALLFKHALTLYCIHSARAPHSAPTAALLARSRGDLASLDPVAVRGCGRSARGSESCPFSHRYR